MSVKYWWSDDLQWFCILVDDGVSKSTVSLSRDEAADLSAEADPKFADMLGRGREFALKALADARQAALTAPSQPASGPGLEPRGCPTPGACSCPATHEGKAEPVAWMARCKETGGRLFAHTEFRAATEGEVCYAPRPFEVVPLYAHPPAQPAPAVDRGAMIKHMTDRFLGWRLPEDFNPDGGISFKRMLNEHTAHLMKNAPTGTNLFDATQATAMVRYMIEGLTNDLPRAQTSNDEGGKDAELVRRLRAHVNDRGGPSLNGAWKMMLDAADRLEALSAGGSE